MPRGAVEGRRGGWHVGRSWPEASSPYLRGWRAVRGGWAGGEGVRGEAFGPVEVASPSDAWVCVSAARSLPVVGVCLRSAAMVLTPREVVEGGWLPHALADVSEWRAACPGLADRGGSGGVAGETSCAPAWSGGWRRRSGPLSVGFGLCAVAPDVPAAQVGPFARQRAPSASSDSRAASCGRLEYGVGEISAVGLAAPCTVFWESRAGVCVGRAVVREQALMASSHSCAARVVARYAVGLGEVSVAQWTARAARRGVSPRDRGSHAGVSRRRVVVRNGHPEPRT